MLNGLQLCMPCVGADAGAAGKGTGASAPAYDFPLCAVSAAPVLTCLSCSYAFAYIHAAASALLF